MPNPASRTNRNRAPEVIWNGHGNLTLWYFGECVMKTLSLAVVLALLPVAAAAQKNDWLIVPGQRVGPITASTTRAELNALFGADNVHDGRFEGGDVPEAATVVYESDRSASLAVTWDRERPASIHICFATETGPCRWRTASGIRIGLPIRELEKINGKTFQVSGFNQERGQVVSWRKGALEEDPNACGHLVVRLNPAAQAAGQDLSKGESDLLKQLQGDKPYASSYLPLVELNTIVSGLELQFTGSSCGR